MNCMMRLDIASLSLILRLKQWSKIMTILGQTINIMKQMTTKYLYRNETSRLWLRKFYYAKRLTVWTNGYFASTVGQVSEKIVLDYIENQGK